MSTTFQLDEQAVRAVVEDVMRGLGRLPAVAPASQPVSQPQRLEAAAPAPSRPYAKGPRYGVFEDVNEACAAAQSAFEQLKEKGIAGRAKVVEIVKGLVTARAVEWGRFEFEETRIG
ncbi:MAG: aldehyde dehydrogenase EutE, partial [Opitutae bacterium]|nr:aldehyde dehydrogenase EutE [Opitutae bacterium]